MRLADAEPHLIEQLANLDCGLGDDGTRYQWLAPSPPPSRSALKAARCLPALDALERAHASASSMP